MTKEMWVALLTFAAALIVGAMKILPVSPDLVPWLTFVVFGINLALAIFFGVASYRQYKARNAAKVQSAK